MLQVIYWIIAIATMLVLLINGVYMLVTNIKNDTEFKRFKKKQHEMLERQVNYLDNLEKKVK